MPRTSSTPLRRKRRRRRARRAWPRSSSARPRSASAPRFHPGAASTTTARSPPAGRRGDRHALEPMPKSSTRVLVENTAGAGSTIARRPPRRRPFFARSPKRCAPARGTGSTCATCSRRATDHGAGRGDEHVDPFQAATGEPPGFVHAQRQRQPPRLHKYRHTLIGEGQIGAETFGAGPRHHAWRPADPRDSAAQEGDRRPGSSSTVRCSDHGAAREGRVVKVSVVSISDWSCHLGIYEFSTATPFAGKGGSGSLQNAK